MKVWQINGQRDQLVQAETIDGAINEYRTLVAPTLPRGISQSAMFVREVLCLGTILDRTRPLLMVQETRSPQIAVSPVIRTPSEAVIHAYLARGKAVGFARDLIKYLPEGSADRFWPGASLDGLAKAIANMLRLLCLEYDRGSSPRLWHFPVPKQTA